MSAKPPSVRVPAYCLHRATGQGVVRLNGKDYYLGTYGTAEGRQRYHRLIVEWLAGGQQRPEKQAPADLTVTELAARFMRHAEAFYRRPDGSPSGEAANFTHAVRTLKSLYGLTAARDFGPKALRAVAQRMVMDGLSRTGINKRLAQIKHVFKWGAGQELLPASVHVALSAVAGLRRGKTEARENAPVRPVPQDHIDAVLPKVANQVQAMIRLQLFTGMRPGEVVIMRTCDIDVSGKLWLYCPTRHKGEHLDKSRAVPIGAKGQEVLRPFLKPDQPWAFLFNPREAERMRYAGCKVHRRPKQKPNPRKTDRKLRERYSVATYYRAIERGCDAAYPLPAELAELDVKVRQWLRDNPVPAEVTGKLARREWRKANPLPPELQQAKNAVDACRDLHRWHPHQLRHNFGTLVRKLYGIEKARVVLGHTSAVVTEIYAEADLVEAQRIIGEVG